MFEQYRKVLLQTALFAGSILAAFVPAGLATANERAEGGSSPYLVGHWKLGDSFKDFTASGTPLTTENSEFVFINPTDDVLTLEYAFFATDDTVPSTVQKSQRFFVAAIATPSTAMAGPAIPCWQRRKAGSSRQQER
jgi:hypothetical protein